MCRNHFTTVFFVIQQKYLLGKFSIPNNNHYNIILITMMARHNTFLRNSLFEEEVSAGTYLLPVHRLNFRLAKATFSISFCAELYTFFVVVQLLSSTRQPCLVEKPSA